MAIKVNVIGGGIAGLTTGCYLQMNGFESEIFEAHSSPGGLCTSWKKGDYTIDGCLHWLVGSNPNHPFYPLWNELIDLDAIEFHYHEEFFRVRDLKGNEIIAFTNLEKLQEELLKKAPEDSKLIEEFVNAARKMRDFPMKVDKAPELYSVADKIKENLGYMPYLPVLMRYSKIRIIDFARRCKNELLSKFFEYSFASEMPLLFILITYSWLDKKSAGYPIGGSLRFSRLFEKRYLELGGKIHYGCKVKRIMTEMAGKKERACGLETESGQQYYSDITVSAADGYATIYQMLGGRFVDQRISNYFENYPVFPSLLQVSLGVAQKFDEVPGAVVLPLDKPYTVDPEKTLENVFYRIINYDPTLAPEGKTLILCMAQTYNYEYWQGLRETDRDKYEEEKKRVAGFFIEQLDRELGGIKENLEMVDVSTPATVIRYTGNWKGSFEGWMVTKETGFDSMPKDLPGLADFYMAGQWVEPGGGVPAVFFSGRNLVQLICARYSRTQFQSSRH